MSAASSKIPVPASVAKSSELATVWVSERGLSHVTLEIQLSKRNTDLLSANQQLVEQVLAPIIFTRLINGIAGERI